MDKKVSQNSLDRIVGQSKQILELKNRIIRLAPFNVPIHIKGETGSGKELVAQAVHACSKRPGSFVAVNCSAIPHDLMESEFFGSMAGSFTGSHSDHEGLFSQAQDGTLFLDEIAELPLLLQGKLLRAIQEKKYRPIGASKEIEHRVRVISATHKDLLEAIENKSFRHDLYYRLNVFELHLPALRDRPKDIELIAQAILQKINYEISPENPYKLHSSVIDDLQSHSWSGNVRELENALYKACVLSESALIEHIVL